MQINTAGEQDCLDSRVNETKAGGRIEIRKVFIYRNLSGISNQWTGLSRPVHVERYVNSKKRTRHETAYYISDIASSKAGFLPDIYKITGPLKIDCIGSKMSL